MSYELIHDKANQRYVMELSHGFEARMDYTLRDGKMYLVYCSVPSQFRGQGIGEEIALKTFEMLTEEGYKAEAVCGFVRTVVRSHDKWRKIIDL